MMSLKKLEAFISTHPGKWMNSSYARGPVISWRVTKSFPILSFNCNGIWFDKKEWDVQVDRNLHDNLNDFFTRSWQDNLRAVETKKNMENIYLQKFGADDYQHIQEIRVWLEDHPKRGMLLAFLQADDPYKI